MQRDLTIIVHHNERHEIFQMVLDISIKSEITNRCYCVYKSKFLNTLNVNQLELCSVFYFKVEQRFADKSHDRKMLDGSP